MWRCKPITKGLPPSTLDALLLLHYSVYRMKSLLLYDPRKTQGRRVAASLPVLDGGGNGQVEGRSAASSLLPPSEARHSLPLSSSPLLHRPHDLFGPGRTLERCPYCGSKAIGTRGRRSRKKESIPGYSCRACRRHFTPRARPLSRGQYPDTQIIEGMLLYCKGHSHAEVARRLCRAYGHRGLNASTVQRWVADRRHLLSYLRLRDLPPRYARLERLVARRRLSHRQTYDYHCHRKKLGLALQRRLDPALPQAFPIQAVADYLTGLTERVPSAPFSNPNGLRGSALKPAFIDLSAPVACKDNQAIQMAQLVVPTVGINTQRHPRLQDFMIHADAATLAVEVPLWLSADEIALIEARHRISLVPRGGPSGPITGHADILQLRNGRLHVLDYKPNARLEEPFAQLAFYALALTVRVPGLMLNHIACAWFDETAYYEFRPESALLKIGR